VSAEHVVTVGRALRGGGCDAVVDGRRAVVRHALPGETVRAVVTGDPAEGRLRLDAVEVLDPAPDRVEEPCPYAKPGRCGGCDWQHASLPAQRRLKTEIVRYALGRDDVTVEPVPVPGRPDDGLAWRTRVQFDVTDDGRLGLHKHRSDELQPLDFCLIASDGVESVGAEAKRWPVAERVEVIGGSSGDRAVVVTPRKRGARVGADVDPDVSVLRGDPRKPAEPVKGRPGVREDAAGRRWWVSGSGFWQSHVAAPDTLTRAVLDALQPTSTDLALDLYAGVGLFAGALAPYVQRVVAVESYAPAVDDARQNLRDLPNVEAHAGRADAVLQKLGLGHVDLVVLDPPRDGAGAAVMRQLEALTPRRIAYVSCDPAALARDLKALDGYAATSVRAYDLFPMTWHVECVALLEPAR
jgi:tRNA/tmRNA/rRNA uracil-C5-methylase (TrmA/RlmC/RlmD family)